MLDRDRGITDILSSVTPYNPRFLLLLTKGDGGHSNEGVSYCNVSEVLSTFFGVVLPSKRDCSFRRN